jgi:hypothetical protein
MKKTLPILFAAFLIFLGFIVGCGGNKTLDAPHLSIIDYQTDVPMLAYAFCKIKPEAVGPLSKFCVAAQIAQDRDAIVALIEEQIGNYRGALLSDEFTRRWLISKAQALIGVTISNDLNILNVDEAISGSKMKEVILLVCEGVRAYKESI